MVLKKKLSHIFVYILIYLVLLIFLFPIIWLITSSIKPAVLEFSWPPTWFFEPTLANYQYILYVSGFIFRLRDSIVVTLGTVGTSLLIGTMAAYSFARLPVKGKQNILNWILTLRFVPPIIVALPLFFLMRHTYMLYDTYYGLILTYSMFNLPIVIWVMNEFIKEIPIEIEEAALIDGAGKAQILFRIVVPCARAGLIATGILTFIFTWNELLYGIFLTGMNVKTASVALAEFITERELLWGPLSAGATFMLLPVTLFIILSIRHIVAGLTLGAVRG